MVEYHLFLGFGWLIKGIRGSKNRSSELDVVEQGHAIEGRSGEGESLARYHFQDFGAKNEDLEARRWERERGESYIVYLGSHSFGPNPSSIDVESVTMSHYDILESYVGSTEKALEAIFYSYKRYINGFAAILDEDEAANVSMHPNVISVFLNKERKLHTTNSWNFLGLERNGVFPHDSVWKKTKGEDIIIGNIDTGVWPESKSFSDEGFGPIPKRWRGICQTEDKFHCNRKLIGARYFYKGYEAGSGIKLNASEVSVRDYEGHGSHTLSTAGGNFVAGASVFGFGNGTASGGSPKARVAAYKACWPDTFFGGCFDADILAAFEAAISDGVDVISMSLGSEDPPEYFQSSISIASFHAVANGITVVGSGGNSGPSPGTVSNNEPWMLTVAASTTNRDFASHVTLGDKKILKGASLSEHHLPSNKMYPLISAVDAGTKYAAVNDTPFCLNKTLDPEKVKGKILVCLRGVNGRIEKGVIAASLGAVGMILANDKDSGNEVLSDPHVLPTSHVNFASGSYIYNYINHTKSPVAYISKAKTELGVKPAPFVASFSSRGPNLLEPAILKPDVTAPGVDIIAAYTEAVSPTDEASDTQRTPYYALSGTSMSCPHVAGLVGLLKAFHPDWSPAAIKSAIITSATTKGNNRRPILNSSFVNEATPFDYGGGHIRPNHAVDPGLVYDLNTADYLNFLCSRGYNSSQLKLFYGKPYTCPKSFSLADFNYPTITVPRIHPGHSVNVTRTVTNVGSPSMYRVLIKAPPQVVVSVEPKKLRFKKKGEKKEFRVTLTLKPQTKYTTDYVFGWLTWTDHKHRVRSHIVVNIQH
ncbi:Subtilisin-like protease SBT5.4 [Glycine soja]|uniref:Subtilisin-like protease SBT5.4 n=1 Tax=Glycine soja TaxID=3848 RepID=A0A445G671_GLYSO|nr:Subtilisin-like protease SBT5.4 [Glycine soja]